MNYTQLEKEMILKAKHYLKEKHKCNRFYKVHPQDIVSELNRAHNSRYWSDFYKGVRCSTKQVKEILKDILL